jgi:hypothetical protein
MWSGCVSWARDHTNEEVGSGPQSDFLKALIDPRHEEHADMLAWVGGAFDPTAFDLRATNQILKTIKPRSSRRPRHDAYPTTTFPDFWLTSRPHGTRAKCGRLTQPALPRHGTGTCVLTHSGQYHLNCGSFGKPIRTRPGLSSSRPCVALTLASFTTARCERCSVGYGNDVPN